MFKTESAVQRMKSEQNIRYVDARKIAAGTSSAGPTFNPCISQIVHGSNTTVQHIFLFQTSSASSVSMQASSTNVQVQKQPTDLQSTGVLTSNIAFTLYSLYIAPSTTLHVKYLDKLRNPSYSLAMVIILHGVQLAIMKR